jgi:hypothetical protein
VSATVLLTRQLWYTTAFEAARPSRGVAETRMAARRAVSVCLNMLNEREGEDMILAETDLIFMRWGQDDKH